MRRLQRFSDAYRAGLALAALPLALLVLPVACGGANDTGPPDAQGGVSGQAGASGDAGGAGNDGDDLVIDDFEDGDHLTLLGGPWYVYDDSTDGGDSSISVAREDGNIKMVGEGFESTRSLLVEYSFDQGSLPFAPFVGFGTIFRGLAAPPDLSRYAGISYSYRGGPHVLRLETSNVTDYDFYSVALPESPTWRTVVLAFSEFVQEGWGEPVPFEAGHATALSWQVRGETGQSGSLLVDDVRARESITVVREPNLILRPPAPPVDDVIDSIEITNPLQEKAMQHLDRGTNLGDWLEAQRFDGFGEYDEAYVANLAGAGFTSLRLPIDMDLYVVERTTGDDGVSLVVHDDLFTVLDAFDEWTAAHGLSLTIDYHQYDRSLDFADSASMADIVALWAVVAEHFAASPREDLFYELLNEPELSVDGVPPTADQWTAFAEDIIAAIRAHDTTHTIVFGDVDWYDIQALAERAPLADPNVIYAFHFYDPGIFVFQGASWAGMATTHDIPYPYSEDRWSEYSSDFGVSTNSDPWLLFELMAYYRTGNKSALRNRIIEAKRWAVTHNVPVICNEFGAYDRTSRMEDRVRYYTDVVDIFAELEIPWQHWFPIMDAGTGAVDAEYREAFRLGEERP